MNIKKIQIGAAALLSILMIGAMHPSHSTYASEHVNLKKTLSEYQYKSKDLNHLLTHNFGYSDSCLSDGLFYRPIYHFRNNKRLHVSGHIINAQSDNLNRSAGNAGEDYFESILNTHITKDTLTINTSLYDVFRNPGFGPIRVNTAQGLNTPNDNTRISVNKHRYDIPGNINANIQAVKYRVKSYTKPHIHKTLFGTQYIKHGNLKLVPYKLIKTNGKEVIIPKNKQKDYPLTLKAVKELAIKHYKSAKLFKHKTKKHKIHHESLP